jgi:SAM-dependent methyltransferase
MSAIALNDKLKTYYDDHYRTEVIAESGSLDSIDKAKNIVNLCSKLPRSRILEIGCGDGSILHRLNELRFADSLYGLEISPTAISLVDEKNISSLVECKLFDGHNIPYENHTFDLAILTHVVEHLEFPRQLLYEAGRVADYVFIEVPLEDHYRYYRSLEKKDQMLRAGNISFFGEGHINVYSTRSLRWFVQTCGFTVLAQIVTIPGYAVFRRSLGSKAFFVYPPLKAAVKLIPSLATKVFTYHCALLCVNTKKQSTA